MASDQDAATLLAALRQGEEQAATMARATLVQTGAQPEQTARERLRADVVAALAGDLHPSDHTIACWLLEQEIAAHEAHGAGASEALYTLVAAVARFARPADALLMWRARQATPETRVGIDAEQFGRLGLAATRAMLEHLGAQPGPHAEQARQALAWLEQSAAIGAFDDLVAYFLWADERFGLTVSGPT